MTRGRKKAPGEEKPKVIEINVPESGTPEDAAAALSLKVPGWDDLTKAEQIELAELAVAQTKARTPVKVKLVPKPDGGQRIEMQGKCEAMDLLKLQRTFGALSMAPVNARANELLKYLGSVGADTTDRYNAALSFIDSMAPQDQAEVLLLVQMYCTHDAAIRALSMMGSAEWVPQVQMFGNLAAKLLRTSQAQMETLARMRRGGEQVVRHVHVDNRGGQAVIADTVHTGGRINGKNDEQSHATGAAGIGPALLGSDPFGNGVPIPSRERAEAVQNARREEPRRTQGQQ